MSRTTTSESHTTIHPQHFPTDFIDQVVCRFSLILDTALLDFHDATMRLNNTINMLADALKTDTPRSYLPCSPLANSIEHLVGTISLILDKELLYFNKAHECLDITVQGIKSAFGDDIDPTYPPSPSITSDQHEMPTSNLGPTAHHTPLPTAASTHLPSMPLYQQYSADPGTTSGHPTPVSFTPHPILFSISVHGQLLWLYHKSGQR